MSTAPEQIKERLNIADFIRDCIEIHPAGSNFKALCPFHEEKTPSFMISPSRQSFKCFGCGKGGDLFSFLEEYEGIAFPEALKILAEKTGVTLPRFNKEAHSKKNNLYECMRLAADFYHLTLLKSKSAKGARDYLEKRGLDPLTIDTFKLGYSSPSGGVLYAFLKKKGFRDEDMEALGLIGKNERGAYDIFRGRLMFPIWDEYGRVVGFGGRILKDDKTQAKYINTRQTELYDKSRVLYGLDKAKDAIRGNMVVLVEGYMDVIASHTAGVKNVVAASGTALTRGQLELMKRFTETVALAFDMDEAGRNAAIKSYQEALAAHMNTRVVHLPDGNDPDDVIREDPKKWQHALENTESLVDYYLSIALSKKDLSNVEDKKQIRDELVPLISIIQDPVERNHYIEKLAAMLGITVEELGVLNPAPIATEPRSTKKETIRIDPKKDALLHLMALMVCYSSTLPKGQHMPSVALEDDSLQDLYKIIVNTYNKEDITESHIGSWKKTHEQEIHDLFLLKDKDYEILEPYEVEQEFMRLASFLHESVMRSKRNIIIQALRQAEHERNEKKVHDLSVALDTLI